jgi:alkanesulfonate monooxygenase SsuD/methylene tetrahydromethanopterin reductase-like flavin-dependent oxidoreductase (luciferase family)
VSLAPSTTLTFLIERVVAAERVGFSGVTVSEHHAGFPRYVPQPLLVSNWLLGVTRSLWSGPCPCLLHLRSPVLVAKELAWTAARYPGRLGVPLASGFAESDYGFLGLQAQHQLLGRGRDGELRRGTGQRRLRR